jgi:nucleotide-binding universal stress UspA family protein
MTHSGSSGPDPRHSGLLLVPLDGSSLAEQALPVAATIAYRGALRLHLVTVFQKIPAFLAALAGSESLPVDAELEQERRDRFTAYLNSTAEALGTTHGVKATWALLEGDPPATLADHARGKQASLIVMTTHGHGGLRRFWLGSMADRMLRRASVPVLLLRPGKEPPPTEFRHVLVAVDGSIEGEGVLEPAVQLGSLCQSCQFSLVQVVEPPIPLITRMALSPARMRSHWRDLQEKAARSYLERLAAALRGRGLQVSTHMVSARGVGEQIASCARQLHADLVAVGTHGASGVERMLLGSVADKVIRGASRTVLVVPTRKQEV